LRSVIGGGCRIVRSVVMGADYYEDDKARQVNIRIGIGGGENGVERESAFDITVASEVMAIFYGDNLPSEVSIGPVADLELALAQACLSQAKAGAQPREKDAELRVAGPTRSASS